MHNFTFLFLFSYFYICEFMYLRYGTFICAMDDNGGSGGGSGSDGGGGNPETDGDARVAMVQLLEVPTKMDYCNPLFLIPGTLAFNMAIKSRAKNYRN